LINDVPIFLFYIIGSSGASGEKVIHLQQMVLLIGCDMFISYPRVRSSSQSLVPMTANSKPNRLAIEKLPYLLQHAYNPVDWFSWSDEAFENCLLIAQAVKLPHHSKFSGMVYGVSCGKRKNGLIGSLISLQSQNLGILLFF
jgi:Protein of unknown function, DUF255